VFINLEQSSPYKAIWKVELPWLQAYYIIWVTLAATSKTVIALIGVGMNGFISSLPRDMTCVYKVCAAITLQAGFVRLSPLQKI
jgi:hypothetical protein